MNVAHVTVLRDSLRYTSDCQKIPRHCSCKKQQLLRIDHLCSLYMSMGIACIAAFSHLVKS